MDVLDMIAVATPITACCIRLANLMNSEIILDRKLTDKRLFPTIDITRSGTRKEELLVDKATLSKMWVLRRVLMQMGMTDGMEFLLDKLRLSKDNQDFFNTMNS